MYIDSRVQNQKAVVYRAQPDLVSLATVHKPETSGNYTPQLLKDASPSIVKLNAYALALLMQPEVLDVYSTKS